MIYFSVVVWSGNNQLLSTEEWPVENKNIGETDGCSPNMQ